LPLLSVDAGASRLRLKGSNDLAGNDIYVIVTPLAPGQYARLNVIGQWLGIPDIIALHYQGIINQAVGRNTGFRQQEGTKTVVVTSLLMREIVPGALTKVGSDRECFYTEPMKNHGDLSAQCGTDAPPHNSCRLYLIRWMPYEGGYQDCR
jgi:hypothetical protein